MTYEILLIVVIGGIGSISGSCHRHLPVCGLLPSGGSASWTAWITGQFRAVIQVARRAPRNGFRMVVVLRGIIMIVVLFFRTGLSWATKELPRSVLDIV